MAYLRQIFDEKEYYVYGLLLLSFFPIFDYGIISISTIIFFLLSIATWLSKGKPVLFTKKKALLFLKLSGFYLLLVISVIYSDDYEHSIKTLFKQIPLAIFPFTFFFIEDFAISFKKSYRNLIFDCFNFSVFTLVSFVFALSIIKSPNEIFTPGFLRRVMVDFVPLDLHPSYVSFYVVTCIYILVESVKSWKFNIWLCLKLILAIYFMIALFLMSSKAIMVAAVLTLFLFILFFVKKSTVSKISISLSILTLTLAVIFSVPTLRARFETVYREFRLPNFDSPSTTPVRVGIYNCAFSLIKQNSVLGYGVGDVQTELNKCYEQYTTDIYEKKDYNTHSYLLYLLLSTGFLGLLFFTITIIYHVRSSIKQNDVVYFSFIVTLFVFLLTENVLVRAYGIIFYCLFSTIFILSNTKR